MMAKLVGPQGDSHRGSPKARAAKSRHPRPLKLLGVVRRRRSALMVSTALQATVMLVLASPGGMSARAQPAPNAHPTGGQVVAGSAAISQSPSTTTITQSSQRAAVNWQSFDVGAAQRVQFKQPSVNAATLNRVVGPNPSQIAGRIDANGQVILVNQDGITFYKGAQVNAAGLVASAVGITNKNFMAGRLVFDQAAHPNARVENRGNITVRDTGLAALVAPVVANSGVITAKLGHVVLAGAKAATLDLYGDGLLSIDVTQQVTQVPEGPDGKPVTALVTNTGTVLADGGTVQLTARAADGIVQNLVTAGGRISAASVGGKRGVIALNGIGGSITVTGRIAATGPAPGTRGGQIEAVADRGVNVTGTARLDASGQAGGGTVAVGTTLARAKGGPTIHASMTAAKVAVHAGAVIAADATANGHGGRVAVLSSDTTRMDGTISAKGGPQGGDGGFVEVSGNTLGLTGPIDVSSPVGQTGTILLDPNTLEIVSSGTNDQNLDGTFNNGTLSFGTGVEVEPGKVSNFEINSLGSSGDVVLQATTLLDVMASVSVGHGLTMQSGGNLIVESGLSIAVATTLRLDAGVAFPDSGAPGVGAITLNDSVLSAKLLDLNANGGVSQSSGGAILAAAGTLQSTLGISGPVELLGTGNRIGTLGSINGSTGEFTLIDSGNLSVAGPLAATSISITTTGAGAITVTGSVSSPGNIGLASGSGGIAIKNTSATPLTASLVSLDGGGGPITMGSGATIDAGGEGALFFANASGVTEPADAFIRAGILGAGRTGTIDGPVSLAGTTNSVGALGELHAQGDLALVDARTLLVGGPVSATNATLTASGDAGILVDGSLSANAATGTLSVTTPIGGITVGDGQDLPQLTGSSIVLDAGTGAIELNSGAAIIAGGGGGPLQLFSGTSLIEPENVTISAGTLGGTISGALTLTAGANAIAGLGNLTTGVGGLDLVTTTGLAIRGKVDATGQAVVLQAAGTINEPTGTLIAGTLAAESTSGDVLLIGGHDTIDTIAGITATQGRGAVIADPTTLTVTGESTAQTLFFENPDPGGTVALNEASLFATGAAGVTPRVSLVGDHLTQPGFSFIGVGGSGIVELAPATVGSNVVVGGTADTVGAILSAIGGGETGPIGTLVIGGFTGPKDLAGTISAHDITIASPLDLGGVANTLALLGQGAVTQGNGDDLLNVGTLAGQAGSFALLNAGNQVGTIGGPTGVGAIAGLTATSGNAELVDSLPLTASGPVSAANGNVFLEDTAAGGLTLAGSIGAQANGTISLVTDALTGVGAPTLLAPGGTVEIAPFTTNTAVTLAGLGGLGIDSLTLGGVQAGMLDVGAYHNVLNQGSITLAAGAIAIVNNVSLGTAAVPVLRLDAGGSITQTGGTLSVGTLSASTHGFAGGVTLTAGGFGNAISGLGNIAVADGDFQLFDGTPLTVPGSSSVYAANVLIESQASIALAGNLAASAGQIEIVTNGANDITVSGGLIGATGTIVFTAGRAFQQTGGTINGSDITIFGNPAGVILSGGTIFGFDTVATNFGVFIASSGGDLTQTGGVIASNSQLLVGAQNALSAGGTIIGAAGVNLSSGGALTASGIVLSGADLAVSGGSIAQTGGTLGAARTASLSTAGPASQTGGIVAGATVDLTAGEISPGGFQSFAGSIGTIAPGSTVATQIVSGATFAADPAGPPIGTLVLPSLGGAPGPLQHLRIEVDNGGYEFSAPLIADWIEFHTLGDTIEDASGRLDATLLSGTAGYTELEPLLGSQVAVPADFPGSLIPQVIASADFSAGSNNVRYLGAATEPYLTTGSFRLNDTGNAAPAFGTLTVAGSVQAGSALGFGQTIALVSPTLVIDASGTPFTVDALPFTAAGSLASGAAIAGGTVAPGEILLQADNFSILPANPLAAAVSAPDGLVAIAALTPGGTITVLGGNPGPGTLAVGTGSAPLAAITTLGPVLPGTPAADTLALGSLDAGKTAPATSAIVFDVNGGTIDLTGVARTVQLNATDAVTQQGSGTLLLPGLAGQAASFTLEPAAGGVNGIATIGNSPIRTAAGTIDQTDPAVLAGLGNLTDLTTTGGDVRVRSTQGTLTVLGTVSVPDGQTIDLAAPTLLVDHASIANAGADGSFQGLGSLFAGATVSAGTVLPGTILLSADALRIEGAPGTPIVSAPGGMVAIAPFTPGNGITVVDSLVAPALGTIAAADLALIDSLGGGLGITPGPLGTETLALGSTDDGATIGAGGITIAGALNLRAVASTLALFAANGSGSGLITQTGTGTISVDTLTGAAGVLTDGSLAGSLATAIELPLLNDIGTIGNTLTRGGVTGVAGQGSLLATGGIAVRNSGDLLVATLVHAGDDPGLAFAHPASGETVDLEVAAGTLGVTGTVWAGIDAALRGGVTLSGGSAGQVGAVNIPGGVFASDGGTVAVASGFSAGTYNLACTAADCGIVIGGTVWGNHSGGHTDADLAGLVQINAASSIDESSGAIGTALLTGGARGFADFSGGSTLTPSGNWIASLGPFDSNLGLDLPTGGALGAGLLLRDGRVPAVPLGAGLTVVGLVQDHGSVVGGVGSSGIEITVAPTANAVADLVLQSSSVAGTGALVADVATGTIDLEATGNVYEQAPDGAFASTLSAAALIAQAGALPGSEAGGNVPGTIPGTPLSLASVWLANANQVGTLENATATQEFLLQDMPGLLVAGTVLAGAAVASTTAANTVGTPIVLHADPTVAIDVTGGDLTVGGVVHAGLDGVRAGDVALTAPDVFINGSAIAAFGGAAGVGAGGSIEIPGLISGGPVALNAGTDIDEPGTILAGLLTGSAGGHAIMPGSGAPTANRIADLGPFGSHTGFLLRDGQSLTVVGAVADPTSVSLAVAPGGLVSGYGAGDLVLQSTVSSAATVTLQATGNVVEQGGGTVIANALIAQAGAIPDTEGVAQQNDPGSVPTTPVTLASVTLGNANTLATLGNVTATQDVLLNNGANPIDGTDANLTVTGTVLAGAAAPASPAGTSIPTAEIDVLSAVGGTSNLTIGAGATIDAGFALAGYPGGNVVLHAGDVLHPGGIEIAALGTVLALPDTLARLSPVTSGVALLTAGVSGVTLGSGGTAVGGAAQLGTVFCAGCSIDIAGLVSGFPVVPAVVAPNSGSTVALYASGAIDENSGSIVTGTIAATVLTGEAGGRAALAGAGAPTANRIAQLGSFTSNALTDDPLGFLLRDGQALTVVGSVSDLGPTLSRGVSIAVAPPGLVLGGYGIADLAVGAPITALTAVALQATGNVYEQSVPTDIITAPQLRTQAGAIPDTEGVGEQNAPGSVPISPLSLASVWLGNLNQIGTLAAATATQEFLLHDGQALIVPASGTVLAGAAPDGIAAAGTAGTPIVLQANPTAGIDVTGGDLTIGGVVHAGLDGTRTGDVALAAADVFVGGGVFAAHAGTVSIATTGSIEVPGTIWGDQGAPAALAALVHLNAGAQIDEPGAIGAVLLTGRSGGHASLIGADPHTGNQIVNLGSFESDAVAGDPAPGFELHDGLPGTPGLTVVGPVADDQAGVTIAVAPAGALTGGYGLGDLDITGTISAVTTVNLQATGNVYEATGLGTIIAAGLIAEAGAIPGTETGGDAPGTIPASPLSLASVWLGNANQVGTLAAATATQEFLLNDLTSLLVPAGGTVLAGAAPTSIIAAGTSGTPIVLHTDPAAEIDVGDGDLAIGGVVHAGLDGVRTGDALLDGGNVTISGGVFAAHAGAVVVASRGSIEIPGVIWGDQGAPGALAGAVGLTAATAIDETGSIGANVLIGSSGGHAGLTGADPHTGNQIISLGGFDSDTATDDPGGFVLHDGVALTVGGTVTDHGAASSRGVAIAVAPAGTLAAGYGLGDLAIANAISAMTAVDLQATGNVYETSGSITAPTLRTQAGAIPGSEAIPQANQPGAIPASPLALASVWLGNTNQVGTLAAGTSTQEFLLKDGSDLTVPTGAAVRAGAAPGALAGAATAGTPIVLHTNPTAELDASGGLTLGGLVQAGLDATRPGDVILTGTNVAINGSANATDGGALSAAAAGVLTVAGATSSGTAGLTGASVSLSGAVNATASVTAAATSGLSVFGTITTGIATLQGASITVAGLMDAAGGVTAVAGDTLSVPGTINTGVATLQAASITVGGTLNAATSAAATAGSSLLVSGVINTAAASLQATSLAVQGTVNAAGSLLATAGNDLSISGGANAGTARLEAASIAIAGALGATGNLAATASGGLSISGAVTAGSANLQAASITIPGAISAVGNLEAMASNGISIPGALNAGSATLSGSSIAIHGRSNAGTSLALISAGTIDATDGNLTTPLLTGSAGTNATLSGSNQIGQLSNFSAGGTLEVNDNSALLLSGVIVAPLIIVNDPQQITLGDGAQIVTGGIARPPSLVLTATGSNSPLADPAAFGGAYLTDFQQIGNSTVSGIGGGPSILGIAANPGKSISFSNLSGLNTWAILQTVGNATISGNLFVKSLDVVHLGPGGSANLFGEINGLPGVQAAGAGKIAPTINASFRFNNCTISSVNCILLPTLTIIPTANPLNDFSLTASSSPDDDEDLLLPIVSDEDY